MARMSGMSGRRRDGAEIGDGVGPDQQDRAGNVIDHKPGVVTEAARSEPRPVPVAGTDQQLGMLTAGHHLALNPPHPHLAACWAA